MAAPAEINVNKFLTLTALTLVLGGCAVTPGQTRGPSHSVALQAMNAIGLGSGLRDASAVTPDAQAYLVPGVAGEVAKLTREGIRIISWIPAGYPADEQDAQFKWGRHLETVAINALPEGYATQPFEWTNRSTTGQDSALRVLRVSGPLCPDWTCVLEGAFVSQENAPLSQVGRMQKVPTPAFVKHADPESYTQLRETRITLRRVESEYLEVGRGMGSWYRINTVPVPEFDHNGFYKRLSAALQPWNYIYIGPENGAYKTTVPLVLNQGTELYFAKP